MPSLNDALLIFTDLDGTLLDSHTYDWQPAAAWLAQLQAHKIPVVLCSSKTAAEMMSIQKTLGLQGLPFIAENGAVVHLDDRWQDDDAWPRLLTGTSHQEIVKVLTQLREKNGDKFTLFSELDERVIAELTGLPPAQASLARLHEASETVIWRDSDTRMLAFEATLAELGLRFVQGARFWHVLDERAGKDQAVKWLTKQYQQREGKSFTTLGLGDGPNDAPLLDNVDYAVVVKGLNREGVTLRHDAPPRVYRTELKGPAGWREGLDHMLDGS
nr:mannosyl-3-phosphoglycerate phosphatase-related protein [uncultured Enterobacter sp.]